MSIVYNLMEWKSKFLICKGKECVIKCSSMVVNGLEIDNAKSAMNLGHKLSTNDKNRTLTLYATCRGV